MPDREKTIIPLDTAHKILSSFGIGPNSKGYQRWRRDEGFRWVDLEDVLSESPSILSVDWRELLQDAADTIIDQLQRLGIAATADFGSEGVQGYLEVDGKKADIKYIPNDDDDFDSVVRTINDLISERAHYRKFQSSIGSDGWAYGILPAEEWSYLESDAPDLLKLMFVMV